MTASQVASVSGGSHDWEVSSNSEDQQQQDSPDQRKMPSIPPLPRLSALLAARPTEDRVFDLEEGARDESSSGSAEAFSENPENSPVSGAVIIAISSSLGIAVLFFLLCLSCCSGRDLCSADLSSDASKTAAAAEKEQKQADARLEALVAKRLEQWKEQNPALLGDTEKTAQELEWLHVQHVNAKADEILKVLASNTKKHGVVAEVFSDPRIKQDLIDFLNAKDADHMRQDAEAVADLFVETSAVLKELKDELAQDAIKHLTKHRNKKLVGACTYGSFFVGYCAYLSLNCGSVKKYYGMSQDDPKWDKAGCYTIFFAGILFGALCAMLTYLSYAKEYAGELAEMQASLNVAKAIA